MDMSCDTIPIFGKERILYRENDLAYMINNKDNLENHPIYIVDTDMGFTIFYNDLCPQRIGLEPSESAKDEANH